MAQKNKVSKTKKSGIKVIPVHQPMSFREALILDYMARNYTYLGQVAIDSAVRYADQVIASVVIADAKTAQK